MFRSSSRSSGGLLSQGGDTGRLPHQDRDIDASPSEASSTMDNDIFALDDEVRQEFLL
jgi:hypothetical protein